jgi:epoxyqueuosine reductase
MDKHELTTQIAILIKNLVAQSPLNRLSSMGVNVIFDEPLVGVADGRDPLFSEYKKIIGEYYMTPTEAMQKTAESDQLALPKDISVVCWVLPWTAEVRQANARKTNLPASSIWSQSQETGEKLNNTVRQAVAHFFKENGYVAAIPMHPPLYVRYGRYLTNWSERHALYVAGLGTFGLSRWFITEHGIAMRCGSVIVGTRLTPTPRHYRSYTENCLFYSNESCTECINRCPAGAITKAGLDKARCREYLDIHAKNEGCGLCQTNVPCEARIPAT